MSPFSLFPIERHGSRALWKTQGVTIRKLNLKQTGATAPYPKAIYAFFGELVVNETFINVSKRL